MWQTSGANTDHYRITTALTPFGNRHTPRRGRHSTTFVVDGKYTTETGTPRQHEEVPALLDKLIDKARAERK